MLVHICRLYLATSLTSIGKFMFYVFYLLFLMAKSHNLPCKKHLINNCDFCSYLPVSSVTYRFFLICECFNTTDLLELNSFQFLQVKLTIARIVTIKVQMSSFIYMWQSWSLYFHCATLNLLLTHKIMIILGPHNKVSTRIIWFPQLIVLNGLIWKLCTWTSQDCKIFSLWNQIFWYKANMRVSVTILISFDNSLSKIPKPFSIKATFTFNLEGLLIENLGSFMFWYENCCIT